MNIILTNFPELRPYVSFNKFTDKELVDSLKSLTDLSNIRETLSPERKNKFKLPDNFDYSIFIQSNSDIQEVFETFPEENHKIVTLNNAAKFARVIENFNDVKYIQSKLNKELFSLVLDKMMVKLAEITDPGNFHIILHMLTKSQEPEYMQKISDKLFNFLDTHSIRRLDGFPGNTVDNIIYALADNTKNLEDLKFLSVLSNTNQKVYLEVLISQTDSAEIKSAAEQALVNVNKRINTREQDKESIDLVVNNQFSEKKYPYFIPANLIKNPENLPSVKRKVANIVELHHAKKLDLQFK